MKEETITLANIKTIHTDTPFKDLFPISEAVLERIIASIKKSGFDSGHPIVLWRVDRKLIVVDGHTRLLAAKRLGMPKIPVILKNFEDETNALEYAIGSQRNRRSLTDAELLMCISQLDKRRKAGRPKNGDVVRGKSASKTALVLGISRPKVERLRTVNDHAVQAVKDAVLAGNLTINKAYVITMETRKEQEIKDAKKLKAARRSALLDSIRKMIRRCIDSEIRKHPDFRLTEKEAAEMLKEISDRLKTELDKLTEKGTN